MTDRFAFFPPTEPFIADLQSGPEQYDSQDTFEYSKGNERADLLSDGFLPPPRDQLPCNSCCAHGLCGIVEISLLTQGTPIELAADWVHTCVAGLSCPGYFDLTRLAAELLGRTIPTRDQYDGSQGCTVAGTVAFPQLAQIYGHSAFRNALDHGHAVAAAMYIDEYFKNFGGDIYSLTGTGRFHHVVTVVGYDNAERTWLCRNSFGDDWANGGYFKVGYRSCGLAGSSAGYCVYSQELGVPVWAPAGTGLIS